jgi:rare lipoprotein A
MTRIKLSNIFLTGVVVILATTLNGCGTAKKKPVTAPVQQAATARYRLAQDTAPHPSEKVPDLHKVPDATPQKEPKSKYGNPKTYTVFKKSYTVLPSSKGYKARGTASWYGKKFHGYRTSSGEPYDMYGMSAAHKTLPLPTYAKVTNVDNGKSVIVKINDRGPFHEDRIIDLSYAAATKLGILGKGTGNVEVHAIDPDTGLETDLPVHYLQIGEFKNERKAKEMAGKLQKVAKGHPIKIKRKTAKNKSLYHVHIGPIKDETVAKKLTQKLRVNNFPTPIAFRN